MVSYRAFDLHLYRSVLIWQCYYCNADYRPYRGAENRKVFPTASIRRSQAWWYEITQSIVLSIRKCSDLSIRFVGVVDHRQYIHCFGPVLTHPFFLHFPAQKTPESLLPDPFKIHVVS